MKAYWLFFNQRTIIFNPESRIPNPESRTLNLDPLALVSANCSVQSSGRSEHSDLQNAACVMQLTFWLARVCHVLKD